MISVIIPAYNESAVIVRTVTSVLAAMRYHAAQSERASGETDELIVVCNGCVDDTYDKAIRFAGDQRDIAVRIIDIEQGSKIAALNAGDAAAGGFPRFYLDADIELSENALHEISLELAKEGTHAAAPAMRCIDEGGSAVVAAFYRVWLSRPYHRRGHVGSGFVGIDREGRGRFAQFPDIIADDEFVRRQFADHERMVVPGATFSIRTPRTVASLIKVKTRSRLGTLQLQHEWPSLARNTESAATDLGDQALASCPPTSIEKCVYAVVVIITRLRAAYQFRRGQTKHWERDETSRGDS